MPQNGDRRQSPAGEDSRLTGDLINATMRYLNSGDQPDEKFAGVVLDGCTAGKGSDYPPKGHGYPSKTR